MQVHKEIIQQGATMYQNFIIPHLYKAQHYTYEKPENASAGLGS